MTLGRFTEFPSLASLVGKVTGMAFNGGSFSFTDSTLFFCLLGMKQPIRCYEAVKTEEQTESWLHLPLNCWKETRTQQKYDRGTAGWVMDKSWGRVSGVS